MRRVEEGEGWGGKGLDEVKDGGEKGEVGKE